MAQEDLPAYTVREHHMVRGPRLRVSGARGLEVVVPPGFDRRRIPGLLRRERPWIEEALRGIAPPPPPAIPNDLAFPALGEVWRVRVAPGPDLGVTLRREGPGRLLLSGAVDDAALALEALRRFGRARARAGLIPWFLRTSAEERLPVSRVTLRGQTSRWGSCTASGAVSLNWKLLFLPPRLVRYVFLHELCHTLRCDHSPAFWGALLAREPEARALARELRGAASLVPPWA